MWWISMTLASEVDFSAVEYLERYSGEPSIAEVQQWASEAALADPDRLERLLAQSRWFAALPAVKVEGRLASGWQRDWEYLAKDGDLNSPDDDTFDALTDVGADADRGLSLGLSWDLDRLVLSSERIRVLDQVYDAIRLRDQVVTRATKAYFERRRLQAEIDLGGPWTPELALEHQLQLEQWTAEIDQLTGGKFSGSW